jgi:hypothetical protein
MVLAAPSHHPGNALSQGTMLIKDAPRTVGSCTAAANTVVAPAARATRTAVESVDDAIVATVESLSRH